MRICESVAPRLGVQYQSVRILEMKTRWGSGGPDGQLRFNWRIVMAPRALVEYVVAHELCHLRHSTHSPAFWRLLAQFMPDHEDRRQRLAILGPTFDASAVPIPGSIWLLGAGLIGLIWFRKFIVRNVFLAPQ